SGTWILGLPFEAPRHSGFSLFREFPEGRFSFRLLILFGYPTNYHHNNYSWWVSVVDGTERKDRRIWFRRSVLNFNHPDIMTTSNANTNNTIVKRENPYKKLERSVVSRGRSIVGRWTIVSRGRSKVGRWTIVSRGRSIVGRWTIVLRGPSIVGRWTIVSRGPSVEPRAWCAAKAVA